jgi:hypothetical protein
MPNKPPMSLSIQTRRRLLRAMALSAAVPAAAIAQKSPESDAGYALWQDFTRQWNSFAETLNAGIFDQKRWEKVRKAFRRLEEKCEQER